MQEADDDRSIAAQVAKELAVRIVTGVIAPGTKLRQDEIAVAFGSSHVPVREAFRRLEAQGLVVAEPRRGVRVPPINPADVAEVTAMRAALEVLALRAAAPHTDSKVLAEARAALDQAAQSANILDWERSNRAFHRALVAPCGMKRLLNAIDDLHRADARFLFSAWQDLGWKNRSDYEHEAILKAVKAKNTDRAAALLSAHITKAGEALVKDIAAKPRLTA